MIFTLGTTVLLLLFMSMDQDQDQDQVSAPLTGGTTRHFTRGGGGPRTDSLILIQTSKAPHTSSSSYESLCGTKAEIWNMCKTLQQQHEEEEETIEEEGGGKRRRGRRRRRRRKGRRRWEEEKE